MKRLLPSLLLCLFGIASGPGCATIVAGGPDKVALTSDPPGASILVDGKDVGQTPTTVVLSRRAKLVTFSKAGYEDTLLPVQRHFNGAVLGNILFGGLLGVIIDYSTGNASVADSSMHAVLRLSPSPAQVSSADLPRSPATRKTRRNHASN